MLSPDANRRCFNAASILLICLTTARAWPSPDVSVTKSVEPQVPAAGEPVEFEIVVSNSGDDTALDVHLTERLPATLRVPDGMAVFVSQGSYDADSGDWALGDIAAGASATMTIPAEVATPSPPPCIVNTAGILSLAGDASADDDSATASVRQPGVERCVDLTLENAIFSVPEPFCSDVTSASLTLRLINNGPDEARSVAVVLSQSPERLPNFRFTDSGCGADPARRCDVGTMGPRELRVLTLSSDQFNNGNAYTVTFQLEFVTEDADYVDSDNEVILVREVPATVTPPCDIPLPAGIGAPACFVATAAWGTPGNDNVKTLRKFRDRHLLTNAPGRAFVDFYYRNSPQVAAYIVDKPLLRAAARAALTPVVVTVRHPVHVSLWIAIAFCLFSSLRRTRRRPTSDKFIE